MKLLFYLTEWRLSSSVLHIFSNSWISCCALIMLNFIWKTDKIHMCVWLNVWLIFVSRPSAEWIQRFQRIQLYVVMFLCFCIYISQVMNLPWLAHILESLDVCLQLEYDWVFAQLHENVSQMCAITRSRICQINAKWVPSLFMFKQVGIPDAGRFRCAGFVFILCEEPSMHGFN